MFVVLGNSAFSSENLPGEIEFKNKICLIEFGWRVYEHVGIEGWLKRDFLRILADFEDNKEIRDACL